MSHVDERIKNKTMPEPTETTTSTETILLPSEQDADAKPKKNTMDWEEKARLKSELDTTLKGIENSIGAFGGSTLGLLFVYRKLLATDPALMFGEDTEAEALDMDRQTNDAIIAAARNSNGFSRQLFEWVGKYNDTDPELVRLNASLHANATMAQLDEREREEALEQEEIDREARDADLNYVPAGRFARFTRMFSRSVSSVGGIKDEGITTLIPYVGDAVGKEVLPLLLNFRPPPSMIVKLLNFIPTFSSPYETLKHISARVVRKIDPSGTHIAPMADRIIGMVSPILMPLLSLIAKSLAFCLKQYTHIINSPRLAKYVNAAVRVLYKLLGWIYHVVAKIITFVVVLVYAIIKFIVNIVLTVIGNTAVTLVVTTILDLIHF